MAALGVCDRGGQLALVVVANDRVATIEGCSLWTELALEDSGELERDRHAAGGHEVAILDRVIQLVGVGRVVGDAARDRVREQVVTSRDCIILIYSAFITHLIHL